MKRKGIDSYEDLKKRLMECTSRLRTLNKKLKEELKEHRMTIESLKRTNMFLENILQSIRDPLCIFQKDFKIVFANNEYAEMKGVNLSDIIGKRCYSTIHKRRIPCKDCIVKKTIESGNQFAKEKIVRRDEEIEFWWEIYTYPVIDEKRDVAFVIEYARDITGRKRAEEENRKLIMRLKEFSRYDDLTGLLNRKTVIECLYHEFEKSKRYGGELSIVFCDVDNFKEINDICGHIAGDTVLKNLADALKNNIRKTDIIGRYGGDEFLLILPGTSLKGTRRLAEKIRNNIMKIKFPVNSKKFNLSMSFGIAGFNRNIKDHYQLIHMADQALYRSKNSGKNIITIYSDNN